MIRVKEGHYITMKESIYQEDAMILNVYTANSQVSEYMEWKLLEPKEEIESSTLRVVDFNTFFYELW